MAINQVKMFEKMGKLMDADDDQRLNLLFMWIKQEQISLKEFKFLLKETPPTDLLTIKVRS